MLYIITGANGHLGNNLVRRIKLNGHEVRALLIDKDNPKKLEELGAEIYFGDVTIIEKNDPIFDLTGTNYSYDDVILIHAAGIISITSRKNSLMEKVNVKGTSNILNIFKELNMSHLVYVSSVHAIKELDKPQVIKETYHFDKDLVHGEYAKTKAEATKIIMDAYIEGYPISIAHPSGIIGPNDYGKGHLTKMIEKYLNKELSTGVVGKYDFVDVRDVANGIYEITAGKHLGPFILSGNQVTLKEMFNTLKEVSGRKKRISMIAMWFVKMFTWVTELYYRIKKEPPLFTRYSLYTLETNCNFSHEKATKTFGYSPRSFKNTIIDTSLWLIDEKRIKIFEIINFINTKFRRLYN